MEKTAKLCITQLGKLGRRPSDGEIISECRKQSISTGMDYLELLREVRKHYLSNGVVSLDDLMDCDPEFGAPLEDE